MKKLKHKMYGLDVYEIDGKEYAVGTETQANKAAAAYVKDSVWAFRAEFLSSFLAKHGVKIPPSSIADMQRKMSEDANSPLLGMIGRHLPAFTKQAVQADGRGHFLSHYDGREVSSDSVGLPAGKLAYRVG